MIEVVLKLAKVHCMELHRRLSKHDASQGYKIMQCVESREYTLWKSRRGWQTLTKHGGEHAV